MNCWQKVCMALLSIGFIVCGCVKQQDGKGHHLVNDPTYRGRSAAYPHARKAEYIWGFSNASKDDLHGVGIKWKDGVAAAGELRGRQPGERPGGGPTDNEGWDPMPDRVTLHWSLDDKIWHEQVMEVATALPDALTFTGTIWFKYLSGGTWVMIPISKTEQMRRSKAYLPTP